MNKVRIHTSLCLRLRLFSCLFSLLLIPGLADESGTSNSSNEKKGASKKSSSTELRIMMIFLALIAVGAFGIFLYKLWQRKKREEQHARLLKLFEQDDDLEVELGMRD